jgi:hypothetical protein
VDFGAFGTDLLGVEVLDYGAVDFEPAREEGVVLDRYVSELWWPV